jgi:phage tail sheath protein FI
MAKNPANVEKVTSLIEEKDIMEFRQDALDLGERLKPIVNQFMFEPNDESTRTRVAEHISKYLETQDLEDYTVECDEHNNTEERIAHSELWADVAVQFKGAKEFIYLPIRMTVGTIDDA